MYQIEQGAITITAGDTGGFFVRKFFDGSPLPVKETDTLTMTVLDRIGNLIFEKTGTPSEEKTVFRFDLRPEDTDTQAPGEYSYTLKLVQESGIGQHITTKDSMPFYILKKGDGRV